MNGKKQLLIVQMGKNVPIVLAKKQTHQIV
jgi:hypothetical protein